MDSKEGFQIPNLSILKDSIDDLIFTDSKKSIIEDAYFRPVMKWKKWEKQINGKNGNRKKK